MQTLWLLRACAVTASNKLSAEKLSQYYDSVRSWSSNYFNYTPIIKSIKAIITFLTLTLLHIILNVLKFTWTWKNGGARLI
jgi:hypothetical protein